MQAIPIPRRRTTHDATSTSPHPSPPHRNPTHPPPPPATTALALLQAPRPLRRRRHLDVATPALTPPTPQPTPPTPPRLYHNRPHPARKPPISLLPRHHRTRTLQQAHHTCSHTSPVSIPPII